MQGCVDLNCWLHKRDSDRALCRAAAELATVPLELTDSTEVSISRNLETNHERRWAVTCWHFQPLSPSLCDPAPSIDQFHVSNMPESITDSHRPSN